jgi:DNA-binding XRE family transcriptional regulator
MAAKRWGLAQRRKAVGLSQEALTGVLDVERSTVVRWESGGTDPLPWIRPKLAQALRLSVDDLGELLQQQIIDGGAALTGPATPAVAHAPVGPTPRQLPAAVAGFTGRAAELAA